MTAENRLNFWVEFICTKCEFPNPHQLRQQFENAEIFDFCDCGCNSFSVRIIDGSNILPIAKPGKYRAIFEADFRLEGNNQTLELILFSDENGNLAYVEIDCCGNSYPVPQQVNTVGAPFHVHKSEAIAL